jgi:peptidoglycan hydrolase-like protein with peptidoglycan-binding domain
MDAGESGRAGEPRPEQRQVLTKDQMQKVQERLTAEGVDLGPADGVMNPRTEAAIRH